MNKLEILEHDLQAAINKFSKAIITTNGAYNAPVDRRDLEKFQESTANALREFKNSIIDYLNEK